MIKVDFNKKAYLSPSTANMFFACRAKGAFHYAGYPSTYKSWPITEVSNMVHDTIDRSTKQGPSVFDLDIARSKIEHIFTKFEKIAFSVDEAVALAAKVFDFVKENKYYEGASEFKVQKHILGIEKKQIHGRFDLVYPSCKRDFSDVSDEHQILDWKLTTQPLLSPGFKISSDYIFQMGVYAGLSGIRTTTLKYFGINTRKKSDDRIEELPAQTFIWTDEKLGYIKDKLEDVIHTIERGSFFPNRSYEWCRKSTCSFWDVCHEEYDF